MKYRIEVAEPAELDLADGAAYIALDSPRRASQWLKAVRPLMASLREMPLRFSLISECEEVGISLRAFHYHSHRVIYRVDEDTKVVKILRVLHNSRRPLSTEDVADLE
jgi:plasmid stabilization system protein ParE